MLSYDVCDELTVCRVDRATSWSCDELTGSLVAELCTSTLDLSAQVLDRDGPGTTTRREKFVRGCWRQESHNISVSLDISAAFVGHTPDYISELLTPVADIPTRSSLRASSNGNLFLAQPVIINSKIDEFIIKRYITFNAQAWTNHSCISIRGMSPLSNSIQCHMHATALLFSL